MKEPIVCLYTRGGILPDAVRMVLIAELCKIEPGGDGYREFSIDGFDCRLKIFTGANQCFIHSTLGNCASGFRCCVIIDQLNMRVMFLADVSLQERRPPEKGALILPLF